MVNCSFNYYTTRIDDYTTMNSIGDFLLTPLRWAVGGKEYTVVRIAVTDTSKRVDNNFSHILMHENADKTTRLFRKKIGILLTITIVPVLLGLTFKMIAQSRTSIHNYNLVKAWEAKKKNNTHTPLLVIERIQDAPKPAEPTPQELEGIKDVQLNELVALWLAKSRDNSEYTENYIRNKDKLRLWLEDVQNPRKYTFTRGVEEAAADLQKTLKFLYFNMVDKDPAVVERVFLELLDSSIACAPTWVETAHRLYNELKGCGSIREKVLQYVQRVKEEMLLGFFQKQGKQWHHVNLVRLTIGKELGLDTASLNFDGAIPPAWASIFLSSSWRRQIFYELYTPQALIQSIMNKINTEEAGSIYQDIDVFLNEHISNYENVMGTFYTTTKKDKKEIRTINEKGVEQLLIHLGLMQ